ncbi:uncharacterized protein LOC133893122 [Phragmites australis]|uniref:uncharacterized protein LOC133893122 n=1 Tax=Phragmites australis TaxID=29695 RepID=UPI002D788A6A|nr:uncharacterized protein LOC133893122 [Phragmites australis]
MLTTSPPSQVKVQQWTTCQSSAASSTALLPPPVTGRLVTVDPRRKVASAPPRAVAADAEPAQTSPRPQPPPLFTDEDTMLGNYVPVFVMLPVSSHDETPTQTDWVSSCHFSSLIDRTYMLLNATSCVAAGGSDPRERARGRGGPAPSSTSPARRCGTRSRSRRP